MSAFDAKEMNPEDQEAIQKCFERVTEGTGPLDGMIFEGSATQGEAEPEPNQLIFQDGAMLSTGCMPYGFGAGPYTTEKMPDGSLRFSCEIRSLENPIEKHVWQGRVTGDEIGGTMIWSNREGSEVELSFEGKKLKEI